MDNQELADRIANQDKNLSLMQNDMKHFQGSIELLGDRITPMQKQIKEIHASLHGAKGFVAGIVITISVVWAVMATFGIIVWNWLQSIGN